MSFINDRDSLATGNKYVPFEYKYMKCFVLAVLFLKYELKNQVKQPCRRPLAGRLEP